MTRVNIILSGSGTRFIHTIFLDASVSLLMERVHILVNLEGIQCLQSAGPRTDWKCWL